MGVALLASLTALSCGDPDRAEGGAATVASGVETLRVEAAGKDSMQADGGREVGRSGAPPVVLMAGTSLTAGLGLDPGDAYPAVVQRLADSAGLAVHVVNGGLSGETSAGLVRRMGWLLREPPSVVVIETGANDGLRGVDPDSTAANLRRVVAEVRERAPGARLLLVQMEAPPNMGEDYTRRFRAIYPAVARESGAVLVPFLLEGVAGEVGLNQADGVHPNEAGARLVALTVWRSLEPVLAEVDGAAGSR